MRVSCLINHYDYGEYVGEAVASVLAQSRVPEEIVLVDDGSHEPHRTRAREAAGLDPQVRLVEKENGGQLSCFQAGLDVATGDLVFFLDADDRWRPEYVERVLALCEARPEIDFVATQSARVFDGGGQEAVALPSRDLGYSIVLCLARGGAWVGAPTSCLAIRRWVLDEIFPVPNPKAWRTCADEALVYGSSVLGARKHFLGEPLVEYRVHGANTYYGRKEGAQRAYSRRIEGRRLTEHLRRKLALPESMTDLAHHEFRTIEAPTREEYKRYWKSVSHAGLPLGKRVHVLFALFRQYHFGRRV